MQSARGLRSGRLRGLGGLSSCLFAALALAGPPAHAARGALDLEHFRPMLDGQGLFSAESAESLAPFQLSAGFALYYAKNPLLFSGAGGGRPGDLVNDRLTGELLFAAGLLPWLSVGAGLPIALANDQNAGLAGSAHTLGLGAARLWLKARLLQQSQHGLGLSLLLAMRLPTGDANAFLGQNGMVAAPVLALERSFGATRLLANIGFTLRESTRFLDLEVGNELFWRLGVGVRVAQSAELGAELVGATALGAPFSQDERRNPLEAMVGARFFLAPQWQVSVGAGPGLSRGYGSPALRFFAGFLFAPHERDGDGDGVPDGRDACPNERGPAANRGCPVRDADGDGVPDDADACPRERGPQVNRGCPWPDRDKDGVPDKDDACPEQPGPRDNRGCPPVFDTDGDGVVDADDKCPRVPGPKENAGCPWPDADKDGVPDKDDQCPTAPGPKINRGCPLVSDSDGDGVNDNEDACPYVKGPAKNRGCPWPDRDGDGVPDRADRCPDVPGPAKNRGCPWPDTDGDGVTDNEDDCPTEPGPRTNRGCPVK